MSERPFQDHNSGVADNETFWKSLYQAGVTFGPSVSAQLGSLQHTEFSPQPSDTTAPYSAYTAQQGSMMSHPFSGYRLQSPLTFPHDLHHDNQGGMSAPYASQGAVTNIGTRSPNTSVGEYDTATGIPEISISDDGNAQQSTNDALDFSLAGIQSPGSPHLPISSASSDAGYSSSDSRLSGTQGGRIGKHTYRRKSGGKARNSDGIPLEDEDKWKRLLEIPDKDKSQAQKEAYKKLRHARDSHLSKKRQNDKSGSDLEKLQAELVEHRKSIEDLRGELADSKQREEDTRSALEKSEARGEAHRSFISELPNEYPKNEKLKDDVASHLSG